MEGVKRMNLFQIGELSSDEEIISIISSGRNVRIERIVSFGQTTGWYDQAEEEFVALLSGFASLDFEDGRTLDMKPGDTVTIGAHEKHRVSYTSEDPPCVWLCVFYNESI
jgi:cupin 2 domain-containing protein